MTDIAFIQKNILPRLKLSGKLPSPKGIALQVMTLTQGEEASIQRVVQLISADPVLSMRVIKAANVLNSNSSRPLVTIADAVTVLGFRALRQLLLGMALMDEHKTGSSKQFDYSYFWTHSLLTGIAVKHLAELSRLAAAEEIFTLGLLGDIGQLALATIFPDTLDQILLNTQHASLEQRYAQQRDEFGFEQAELSAAMLGDMSFPAIFMRLIHDYPLPQSSAIPSGTREWQLMNMLHLASGLAKVFLTTETKQAALLQQLKTFALAHAIEENHVLRVIDKCVAEWPTWSALLEMGAQQLTSFSSAYKQTSSEGAAHATPAPGNNFKMRVLVVEDDKTMRTLLGKMLQNAGHHVALASNGLEALQLLDKENPQLIVTDWVMPEMDGIAMCKRVRELEKFKDVYIIVETAQESQEKLLEAFEAGADDYVFKPITPKMFLARLRAAQRVVQMQAELEHDREQLLNYSNELEEINKRLQQQVLLDPLTGLNNRRFAIERLEQEFALSKRNKRNLSCLMIDIDHFKRINDKFGHATGDEALKVVAAALRQASRSQDVICRYGGEEFLVICPDTNVKEAFQCAERLRQSVAAQQLHFAATGDIRLTISIGGCELKATMTSVEELLNLSDKKLYEAKNGGRNRTVMEL